MRWWRRRGLAKAARSAYERLEPHVYYPGADRPDADTDDIERAMSLASIQADLVGTSPNDVVSSVATRIAVIRKLSALGRPLAEGAEKQAIRDAALDLYEADTSVAWIVLNAQLGEALAAPLVASWLAGQIPPDSTDPRSAGDAEVRELLAETFADAAVTDLSAREQSDLVLGEPVLSTDRADRWIQKLVDDVWSGEPQRTIPEVSRRELRDQLLRRFGT